MALASTPASSVVTVLQLAQLFPEPPSVPSTVAILRMLRCPILCTEPPHTVQNDETPPPRDHAHRWVVLLAAFEYSLWRGMMPEDAFHELSAESTLAVIQTVNVVYSTEHRARIHTLLRRVGTRLVNGAMRAAVRTASHPTRPSDRIQPIINDGDGSPRVPFNPTDHA